MIFDPSTAQHLKPWLVRTLEPICDAEPGALADYILALLKHNVPETEMRKELAVQLDEFLDKAECSSFIDTLFTVLRTKSYLPYSAASPSSPSFDPKNPDNGIPIPLDGLLSPSLSQPPDRNLKRSSENDERDGRPPAKGPRLSTEGQFSRYTNGHGGRPENRSTGGWGGRDGQGPGANGYRDGMDVYGAGPGGGMGMQGGMILQGMNAAMGQMNGRRQHAYQPPDQKRGICRDYHNNGYCARGAMCKYSHGDDAVVPGMYPINPAGPMPFMPIFAGAPFGMGGGMGAAYDPHEARMDMRPISGRNQRAPLLPRIQQEDGSQVVHSTNASGELPVIQDLTPALHDTDKAHPNPPSHPEFQSQRHPTAQPPQLPHHPEGVYPGSGFDGMQPGGISGQPYLPINPSMDVDINPQMNIGPPRTHHIVNPRPQRGNRGRGGTFVGEMHNFRPEKRNDKTLVVEKIPEDKLTLEHVNEWFKRFGTVTNVAIDSMNAKALISFSNHEEAYAAWKSEDAVFSNRFVKVFWHRPMEGHGQVGAKMLAASAPLVANITAPKPVATSSKPAPPRTSSTSGAASALAAKQQLLEQQIAEQKSLMVSLDTASSEEKKTIMARLRKLGDDMTAQTAVPSTVKTNVVITDQEKKERERLDRELENHSTGPTEGEESTEDLKAKLERLKAEAASLGIPDGPLESTYGGSYRPYRGRGRGIARGYRGAMRGGPLPRASMKLDNRPKKLLVKGVREENTQALRDWFETTGQMDTVDRTESGDIIVAFKTRAAAEQGLAKGNRVPTVGQIQITWYTGKPSTASAPAPKSASSVANAPSSEVPAGLSTKETPRDHSPEPLHSPHGQDEEVIASGWGEDGDGEDGMGML
ncbi:hypothetical protein DXG03_006106 [Asterophora parasitica]|uniref:RNA-binding protein n=1 Tax=Asterophora parasitica TaxID=117018 RepID=A0A9P7GCQ2_9AGAR|nr:hypothetical protein DXG03_006106 [Asterophora parasitica]